MHLKRFVFDPVKGIQKLSRFIKYPETLRLEPPDYKQQETLTYRLFAGLLLIACLLGYIVVYHHGKSATGGHYTSHVRRSFSDMDDWLHFDDTIIRADPPSKVFADNQSQTAYLLFYQKSRVLKQARSF